MLPQTFLSLSSCPKASRARAQLTHEGTCGAVAVAWSLYRLKVGIGSRDLACRGHQSIRIVHQEGLCSDDGLQMKNVVVDRR